MLKSKRKCTCCGRSCTRQTLVPSSISTIWMVWSWTSRNTDRMKLNWNDYCRSRCPQKIVEPATKLNLSTSSCGAATTLKASSRISVVFHIASGLPMKVATLLPLLTLGSFASCATQPNEVIADVYSPSKRYHVEGRKCPQVGTLARGEEVQATVLEAGRAGVCHSSVNAIEQFSVNSPEDQLELEWVSETQLRAWHPKFNPSYGPQTYVSGQNDPVKVIFRPKI